ncbi:MAG: FixH family protein [Crocinitomicaceae bacterium]|nr:FixH family protein [Crocinitomicaceae bacterium]
MNWGKGIAIVIVMFMLYIASFVYRAFQRDADLVTEDYYEQEVNYDQQKIDKQNYQEINGDVTITKNEDGIYLQFPEEVDPSVSGKINFYRPDSKKFDREFELSLDQNRQQILDYDQFYEGNYEVTVQWDGNAKHYIYQENIKF